MTPLAQRLATRIALEGPISLHDWMAACGAAYYGGREPFGPGGDFVTAPDVSQMFGELLGLALGAAWDAQGRPPDAVLAELGPGRGTLIADARRVLASAFGWRPMVALVETSPRLRALQRERLGPVQHCDRVEDLPDSPLFVLANEFFDALPVRQFQRGPRGWHERQVALTDTAFSLGLGPALPLPWPDPPGAIREDCPAAGAIMTALATRIATRGGAAIVLDYGAWDGTGDTVQAVRAHRPVAVLDAPGEADLTAHVAFGPLAAAARGAGAATSALATQGALLAALGIGARAEALARAAPARAGEVAAALHRLTHPAEMGDLFKALAVVPRGAPLPPGFAPAPDRPCS